MDRKKRVLVIGNGFDLDFGSDTRYSTFARGKLERINEKDSNLLRFLKQKYKEIPNKNWFDFEKELESYVTSLPGFVDTETIRADKRDFEALLSIGKYMDIMGWKTNKEERAGYVSANQSNNPALFENPVQIWGRDHSVANQLLQKIAMNPAHFTKIVSFNYTNFYEYLKVAVDEIVNHDDVDGQKLLDQIDIDPIHIEQDGHGGKKPILGVCDSVVVPAGYEFLRKGNQLNKERRDSVINTLKEADELVIFGHSLGDSDSDYFKPLFRDMFSEKPDHSRRITIFFRGDSDRLLGQITKFAGAENIMPKSASTCIRFIDTSFIESELCYKEFLREVKNQ